MRQSIRSQQLRRTMRREESYRAPQTAAPSYTAERMLLTVEGVTPVAYRPTRKQPRLWHLWRRGKPNDSPPDG